MYNTTSITLLQYNSSADSTFACLCEDALASFLCHIWRQISAFLGQGCQHSLSGSIHTAWTNLTLENTNIQFYSLQTGKHERIHFQLMNVKLRVAIKQYECKQQRLSSPMKPFFLLLFVFPHLCCKMHNLWMHCVLGMKVWNYVLLKTNSLKQPIKKIMAEMNVSYQ